MIRAGEDWDEGRRTVLWVSQSYGNYQFFGVEADARLQDPAEREP
jgi:hypothetical protein